MALRQHLTRQLANVLPADFSEGFERTVNMTNSRPLGLVKVFPSPEALAAAQALLPGLAIWSDGSKLENTKCGAGLV